jgi:hypothetical protein
MTSNFVTSINDNIDISLFTYHDHYSARLFFSTECIEMLDHLTWGRANDASLPKWSKVTKKLSCKFYPGLNLTYMKRRLQDVLLLLGQSIFVIKNNIVKNEHTFCVEHPVLYFAFNTRYFNVPTPAA